jgi:hypothetical protein
VMNTVGELTVKRRQLKQRGGGVLVAASDKRPRPRRRSRRRPLFLASSRLTSHGPALDAFCCRGGPGHQGSSSLAIGTRVATTSNGRTFGPAYFVRYARTLVPTERAGSRDVDGARGVAGFL